MTSKCRENEISRQIQNVMTSQLVSRENRFFGTQTYYISFERSFIADHFLLKNHDLKIMQKRNISHFLQLYDKKKSKARSHWNPFFYKHTQIINH